MKILLDTCTLLWAAMAPHSLSERVQQIIRDEKNSVLVSAATAWEIATKVRLGKLPGAERLEREYSDVINESGYSPLSIETEHALRAGRLPGTHRDPFDRMLVAQALALDIPIVSPDTQLDGLGARGIW